jgi:DNA polymerase III delta prime subunit
MRWVRSSPCPYAHDKPAAVAAELRASIAAQVPALTNISDAVAAWAAALDDGAPRPLVLLLTGPTGVGKTETAQAIARALLVSRVPLEGAGAGEAVALRPEGLVLLHGEEFMDASNITRLQEAVREQVAAALFDCRGHAVLVFDEVQKAARGTLAALAPLLQGRRAQLRLAGHDQPVDASRMAVVLISDVGVPEIERFIQDELRLKGHKEDATLLQRRLTVKMRERLSAEFASPKHELNLGAFADTIVAFLPFNQTGARALLEKELRAMAQLPSMLSLADHIEWTPDVTAWFSLPRFLRYSTEEAAGHKDGGGNQCARDLKSLAEQRRAEAAARRAEAGDGGESATLGVGADGETTRRRAGEPAGDSAIGDSDAAVSGGRGVDGSGAAARLSVCGEPCEMPRSCFLVHGGRGIIWHDEGPYVRLQRMLRKELERFPRGADDLDDDTDFDLDIAGEDSAAGRVTVRLGIDCGPPKLLDGTCQLRGVRLRAERCVGSAGGEEDCEEIYRGALGT